MSFSPLGRGRSLSLDFRNLALSVSFFVIYGSLKSTLLWLCILPLPWKTRCPKDGDHKILQSLCPSPAYSTVSHSVTPHTREVQPAQLMYCLQMFVLALHNVLQAGRQQNRFTKKMGVKVINSLHFNHIAAKWCICPCALCTRGQSLPNIWQPTSPEEIKLGNDHLCIKSLHVLIPLKKHYNRNSNLRFHLQISWACLWKMVSLNATWLVSGNCDLRALRRTSNRIQPRPSTRLHHSIVLQPFHLAAQVEHSLHWLRGAVKQKE